MQSRKVHAYAVGNTIANDAVGFSTLQIPDSLHITTVRARMERFGDMGNQLSPKSNPCPSSNNQRFNEDWCYFSNEEDFLCSMESSYTFDLMVSTLSTELFEIPRSISACW